MKDKKEKCVFCLDTGLEMCPECEGTGQFGNINPRECDECNGSGKVECQECK